jgi:hypothetical protein
VRVSALRGEGEDGSTPGARAVSKGRMGVGESQGGDGEGAQCRAWAT